MYYNITSPDVAFNITPPMSGAFAITVLSLLNQLIFNLRYFGRYDQYPPDYTEKLLKQKKPLLFDFIIVGGGTSGCILANRLTQIKEWKVLLIEAGDYPTATSEVPIFYPTLKGTVEDWQFKTEEADNICQGTVDKRCVISKGKALGGTSTIGNMHLVYLNDKLSEEIKTESPNQTHFLKSMLTKLYDDMEVNYMEIPLTIRVGARFNMAKGFLAPIRNRTNLYLIKNAFVTRLFTRAPDTNKIKGVEVMIANGKLIEIEAKKEIILATGAIMTPKILMLSGIGPKDLLEELHIPILSSVVGVGQNFHGHITVPVFLAVDGVDTELVFSTFQYVMSQTGEFATTSVNDFVTYLEKRVAVYHHYFIRNDLFLEIYLNSLNYHPAIINSILRKNNRSDIVLLMITLIKPKSRDGEILIASKDPKIDPIIRTNYFIDEKNRDINALIIGMTKVVNNSHYSPIEVDIPNCRNFKYCSNQYIRCYITNMGYPLSDIAGTAIVGRGCEKNWVVDDNLLVKGVRGLRIADESILPYIVEGNTLATVATIGDAASEMIKERWIEDYVPTCRISDEICF